MAFLQPAPPRQPMFHVPAVVFWLLAVLAGAHLARMLASPEQSAEWIEKFAFIPAFFSPAFLTANNIHLSLWDHLVPFFSYMALHNDLMHLAINSLWLLAFGPVVARRFGTPLFLLFFVVCGVAAAATHLALNWGSPDPVIGASGAISGLMAAGLRLLPTLRPGAGGDALLPIRSRQVFIFSLVWVGMNVIAGVTGLGLGGETGLIAWQAHLGGFAAGMLLAGPFDAWRPQPVGVPLDPG
jgi:membrane associated rhomboid family serine protease